MPVQCQQKGLSQHIAVMSAALVLGWGILHDPHIHS